jgi:hypothetical protein
MNLREKNDLLIILIGILWAAIVYMGWENVSIPAMYLGVVLMFLHMMLGVSKKGILSKKLIVFPLIPWAILWIVSFYLSDYYSALFAGQMPNFTILGFHPSFSWTVLTYWIGGMLTLTLGFVINKDEWLSEQDWEDFKKRIKEIELSETKLKKGEV